MSNNYELNFRQIHMDFHTSEVIPNVAKKFDGDNFAKTLSEAHVNSVTCFARCHHGWLYYDSKKFPHLVHPNLKNKNLLNEQIDSCHKYGIKAPVYITVQWDYQVSRNHPEWLVVDEVGAPIKTKTFEPGFYRNICLNTPYVDFLKEQLSEILVEFGMLDGLFFDILNIKPCACKSCVDGMRKLNLDATDEDVRYEYAQTVMDKFKKEMTEFINNFQPDCPVFYNVSHIGTRHREVIDTFSHLEIESLPSGEWGYMHFPITALYARNLGVDFGGMTGKFHTSWGDFSSFKTKEALEYECFRSLSLTGKCHIGDQLHPSGQISKPVYDLVGSVYKQVEEKEPWCKGAQPVVEVGIFAPEEYRVAGAPLVSDDLCGAVRMLMELSYQCDVIDSKSDFNKYKLLVLPDNIPVNDELEEKLNDYSRNGGVIVSSYKSGLSQDKSRFADFIGLEYISDAPYSPDFIQADGTIGDGLYNTEYVMYKKGVKVALKDESQELLKTNVPYFNRTWEHFCSHRHTPSSKEYGYPAVVKHNNTIYFAHPIFTIYEEYGPRWVKTMVHNAIKNIMSDKLVEHNGPTGIDTQLNSQYNEKRYILHLLHYIPERRTKNIDIIEDIIPLYNIEIDLALKEHINTITIVPKGEEIPFQQTSDKVHFSIPKINGHTMIEIKY